MARFLMAGGGTGGHVLPLLAVARELRDRGHEVMFVGTRTGMEAKLVPADGFAIEWIEAAGLARSGLIGRLRGLALLPAAVASCWRLLRRMRPAAVFSLGGFVAGPAVMAAIVSGVPVVAMEPNAIPGATTRWTARWTARALVAWPQAGANFRPERVEATGVPVRAAFFAIPGVDPDAPFTVLITGGSRGSRTLNRAFRESWPLFRGRGIRFIHQSGRDEFEALSRDFAVSGLDGEVHAFIDRMPAAFARAHVIVGRSGASAVAELCAAGRASILVPFPFAADDHQAMNARALTAAGAARMVLDGEMTGQKLFDEVSALAANPARTAAMGAAARALSKPDAARRAADVLEEIARKKG